VKRSDAVERPIGANLSQVCDTPRLERIRLKRRDFAGFLCSAPSPVLRGATSENGRTTPQKNCTDFFAAR